MALRRSSALHAGVIILCLVLGTWLGIFLQRFALTAPIFVNFADFAFDVKRIDIVMLNIGFDFAMKLNLGTIIGGITGILVSR